VFNEMQGFSLIPHLADLERELSENNKNQTKPLTGIK